jgi:O-antigen/teichoic acid export membrane protein
MRLFSIFVVTLIAALIVGYHGYQLKLLLWMALNQFLNALILYLRSNVSALLKFKMDSFLSVMDKMIMVILCSILLWGNSSESAFKIEWFIASQTIAYLITVLFALFIVLRNSGSFRLYWNFSFFKVLLKRSFPFAVLYLLMACYNRFDSVMLERLLPEGVGAYQSGIYASAFRLLDAVVMIAYLFSVILLPLFSKMLKNRENIVPIVESAFQLLFYYSTTVVVLLIFNAEAIFSFLYDYHVVESIRVFPILITCLIPISMIYVFGTLLTAHGNLRLLNITSLLGILVNVGINFFLIPHLHARGAAIASLSTQSVVAISQIYLAFKALHIPVRKKICLSSIFYTTLLIPIAYGVSWYWDEKVWVALLISGVLSFILAFFTQLLPFSFIRELVVDKLKQPKSK